MNKNRSSSIVDISLVNIVDYRFRMRYRICIDDTEIVSASRQHWAWPNPLLSTVKAHDNVQLASLSEFPEQMNKDWGVVKKEMEAEVVQVDSPRAQYLLEERLIQELDSQL